jgi:hypothetical protein
MRMQFHEHGSAGARVSLRQLLLEMQLDGRAAVTIHDAVELVNSFPRPHIALLDVDIGGTGLHDSRGAPPGDSPAP